MNYLTNVVFEHLDITSIMNIYLSIKYTDRILRGPALKKFIQVLLECKESAKRLAVYQWNLGSLIFFHGIGLGLRQGGRYQHNGTPHHWSEAVHLL